MTDLYSLWMPILVSAIVVFFASAIIYMVLPWHRNDYPRIPQEDQLRSALRPLAIPPGDYAVPRHLSREELLSPAFADKRNQGPVMVLTVMPNGPASMGRNLGLSLIYNIVVG